MKKIQQVLFDEGELQRFVCAEEAAAIKSTFAEMQDPSEDSPEAIACKEAAMNDPSKWVLKPQVEGSGDLTFGDYIPKVLQGKSKEELAEYILMERVMPPVTPSAVRTP